MVVKVLARHHGPRVARHGAEIRVGCPHAFDLTGCEPSEQGAEGSDVGLPRLGRCRAELGRGLHDSSRPRQHEDDELFERGMAQGSRDRASRELPERDAELVSQVTYHLRGGHATPTRLAVGAEAADTGEERLASTEAERGSHGRDLRPPT